MVVEITLDHPFKLKAVASGCAAALGVELIHGVDCLGHFLRIFNQKTGYPGVDDLRQRPSRKRYDRCSARDRLHCHQRACLGNKARDQKTTCCRQKASFARKIEIADEMGHWSEPRPNLLSEITLVILVRKHCPAISIVVCAKAAASSA